MTTIPIIVPATPGSLSSTMCLLASGKSSVPATMSMIPATNDKTLSMSNNDRRKPLSRSALCSPRRWRKERATTAPSGSARPDKLARPNASHGESGRAARQGMAMAIPSGILWRLCFVKM